MNNKVADINMNWKPLCSFYYCSSSSLKSSQWLQLIIGWTCLLGTSLVAGNRYLVVKVLFGLIKEVCCMPLTVLSCCFFYVRTTSVCVSLNYSESILIQRSLSKMTINLISIYAIDTVWGEPCLWGKKKVLHKFICFKICIALIIAPSSLIVHSILYH